MTFINRDIELQLLRRAFGGTSPALFVLYGRRRVGKTALLRELCRERRHVFFTADLGSVADQLRSFAGSLAAGLGEPEWNDVRWPGWEEALRFCLRRAAREPLVLVLDEFQHLVMAQPALASILQRLWDTDMRESQLSLVLCGSYVSFMEHEVLGVRNPLYGRRTGQLRLQPLLLRHAAQFLPAWPADARMEAVGVFGGIPAYLRLVQASQDLETNLRQVVLDLGSPLLEEPRFLMMEELREPQLYFSICRALAHGQGRPNEIAQAAGLQQRNIGPYLQSLQQLGLVERRVPVTVRNPERSRRSLYRLADPFLRFWFRFVLPNRSALEAGEAELVWRRKIEPHLAQHVAATFEDACREHLQRLNQRGLLGAEYDRIGPWWQGPHEVDVAAVADDGPLLLAECKWSTRPVGTNVLETLTARAAAIQADCEAPPTRVDLALCSRAGFTPALEEEARQRGVRLLTVQDLLQPDGALGTEPAGAAGR